MDKMPMPERFEMWKRDAGEHLEGAERALFEWDMQDAADSVRAALAGEREPDRMMRAVLRIAYEAGRYNGLHGEGPSRADEWLDANAARLLAASPPEASEERNDMAATTPSVIYVSTDRQWAKTHTGICTERYVRAPGETLTAKSRWNALAVTAAEMRCGANVEDRIFATRLLHMMDREEARPVPPVEPEGDER